MIAVLLFTVAGLAASVDYEHVLQSPTELKNLFSEFRTKFHKHYTAQEGPMRMRMFRNDLKQIVRLNKEHEWVSGINQFTAMTRSEKDQHLGLNVTLEDSPPACGDPAAHPAQGSGIDWRERGKVTGIKDQGSCGSCWAFSAVGSVETNYAVLTGRRKQFSEQEYLDCSYEEERDGCKGGWYEDPLLYSARTGRLATQAAAPYTGKNGLCDRYSALHNGLQAAVVTGAQYVGYGEDSVIQALNSGAVSVAYEVTDDFFKYTEGIIRDETCMSWANHAVTAVGYTPTAMIVRNSWGTWGMKGYFYTARDHHGCLIYNYGHIPEWKETGEADSDPEYVPSEDADCEGTNSDGCVCGTVRCGDGSCKHAHMCH